MTDEQPGIRTVKLTKKYGRVLAVSDLDLTVDRGELFCFLGPSGAGKTTTIKMLIGMLTPTDGRVFLDGIDVYREPVRAKSIIGYVPDQPNVYQKLTAREFRAMADRVGIIQNGKLLAVGTVGQLQESAKKDKQSGEEMTLEDLFLELTGGEEFAEVSRQLEG